MKAQLISTLLAVVALMWAGPAADAKPLPEVRVEGNRFVDARGETLIFRGLNTSDPDKLEKAGRWNRRYFEEMAAWGANIARFPVHPTAWRSRGPEAYMQLLDQGIAWAGELGIYVIIDWHVIGNLRSGLFQNPMYETTFRETLEFWGIMANRYKDNSTVAFFELYNEPTTGGGRFGTCTWAQWREMLEEMIVVVRAYGSRAIPLVGGFNWAYDLTDVATDPVRAEGVAYVSHPYPMKRDKPWEPQWTADWGFVAGKYPLMLTEIGFCGPDDPGAHIPVISDESYGDAIMKYCDERGISWVVWVFDPNWSPMLFSDWDFTPTRQGRYFKPALIERNKRN